LTTIGSLIVAVGGARRFAALTDSTRSGAKEVTTGALDPVADIEVPPSCGVTLGARPA
jgi:hypothetical protein